MATEPKIFTKNYVNSDDTLSATSGNGSIANICDRDTTSQWVSSGANSDSTDVAITVVFYEGTTAVNRVIDSFLMINHNIKDADLYYYDGATYQLWYSFTNLSATTTFQTLTSQTTSQIQLILHSTQTANQEKAIGELNLMNLVLDFGQDLYTYMVPFRQLTKDVQLGEGSLARGNIRWTYNRIEKYECNWSIILMTNTLLNALLNIKNAGVPFLWYPESISRPDEIWYVHWWGPRNTQYTNYVKGAGNTISATFKEV